MESEQSQIYNEAIPNSQTPGFSAIYRQKGLKQLLSTSDPNIRTIKDIVNQCKNRYGDRRGIGTIHVKKQVDENGKETETRSIETLSYREVVDRAQFLGRAMVNRKMFFTEAERKMNIIGIYSKNRLEWFITDWACALFGLTTVPLYDTLGKQNVAYCIEITGLTTLFVSAKTATEICKFEEKGSLKTIVLYDEPDEELIELLKKKGIQFVTFKELVEEGAKLDISSDNFTVTTEHIYSFCYTSGTTGPPKGALVSHQNLLAAIAGFNLHKDLSFCQEDVYLSYLPLPHLMERTLANCMFIAGAFLVVSCGNPAKIKEDSAAIKTTIFISVPRVFNRIVDAVTAMVDTSVSATDEKKKKQFEEELYKKIRQSYGGNIRVMATGSAPMTAKVQQTMQKIMKCHLIQGYGQTQATCGIVFSRKTSTDFAKMHELTPAVEVKLCDIPQMKYTSKDQDSEGRLTPRGQIWTRGPQIFKGYYKRDEANKETIEPDGWVKSGDVGEFTPNLALKIIDRKKNIFKLQQGQYIAPDKVERIYLKSGLVEEIFLHGVSTQSYAIAVCTPSHEIVVKIAKQNNIQGSFEELCKNNVIKASLLKKLNEIARAQGLNGFELAKNIYLVMDGFASKGILTNTMKLIRYEARNFFKDQIEAMYSEGELKI